MNTMVVKVTARECTAEASLYQYDYGQILQVTGLSLPLAYETHWCADGDEETVTVIGNAEGIEIPDELLQRGRNLICYIFLHNDDDDGETVYKIRIPVKTRPEPTNETPTPVQQDVITQTIAALNQGVEDAEAAAEKAEQIEANVGQTVQDALQEAKESGMFDGADGKDGKDGQDGFSPVVSIKDISGGHEVTITDKDGNQSFDVMDGQRGQQGSQGVPGQDGVSPTVSVAAITGGHEVTITDGSGDHSFDVMDGVDGAKGEKGDKGDPGTPADPTELIDDTATTATDKVWSANKTNSEVSTLTSALNAKYEKPSGGIPAEDLASGVIPAVPVTDVQVDGTSILNQGVANVPVASGSNLGVVKTPANGAKGIDITSDNELRTRIASSSIVKSGIDSYRPIAPSVQHESAFFGLAKAAGADMASVSGAVVGTYPEAQKVAIQKMLGIYQAPWELIREDTVTNASEADISITVDGNGNSFELTDLRIVIISPVQQTQFKKAEGRVSAYYSQNDYDSVYIGVYTQIANEQARHSFAVFEQNNGMVTKYYMRNTTLGDNGFLYAYSQPTGMFYLDNRVYTKVLITKVTGKLTYKLFGRRKWT